MNTLTKAGFTAVLVTMVCATNFSFASPFNQQETRKQFETITKQPRLPAKQFESEKKQPPPPKPIELKRQFSGQINPDQIKLGSISDIGEKISCGADQPGCTPGGSGSGGKPGGGEQPPDCSEVGPNEPC